MKILLHIKKIYTYISLEIFLFVDKHIKDHRVNKAGI